MVPSLHGKELPPGLKPFQYRFEPGEVAERVAGPGEKEHGDPYEIKARIPELLLVVGRMEGVSKEDKAIYVKLSLRNHLCSNTALCRCKEN